MKPQRFVDCAVEVLGVLDLLVGPVIAGDQWLQLISNFLLLTWVRSEMIEQISQRR
jgi:hypothetical protein